MPKLPAFLRSTNFALLAAALLTGALAFWGASRYVTGQAQAAEARVAGRYEQRAVLVAAANLAAGAPLGSETLAQRRVPVRFLASDTIAASQVERIAGRRLTRVLKAGDPVTWSAIEAAQLPRLSASLESGLRAITFPVDEVNSFSGMLTPGDLVDLLYTVETPSSEPRGGERPFTVLPLLQSVRVLATGSQLRRQKVRGADGQEREVAAQFVTVTLHVTPADAARIVLAQRSGELTAVLRNPQDPWPAALQMLDSRSLYPRTVRRVVQARKADYVEFIIGGRGNALGTGQRVAVQAPMQPAAAGGAL